MPVSQLQVTNLRNLQGVSIALHPRLNLFYGENGSGKTSILESVNVLALGRSFRQHKPKPLIHHESAHLTVFGEVISDTSFVHRVGVQKTRQGDTAIKIDGKSVLTAAALAENLPVLTINSQSFDLIEGSAKPRRQLLDWLAFHVEPLFLPAWKSLQHCLKQRNSLLRRGRIAGSELRPWNSQLATLANQIHAIRLKTFEPFYKALGSLDGLLSGITTELDYKPGWNTDQDYLLVLEESLERDLQRGYTHYGPHRADIRVTVNHHSAAEMLSRGQQKVLACGLIVAQGKVFGDITGRSCVYLIDDLPSELDDGHRLLLGRWLTALDVQMLVTGVEKAPLLAMWPEISPGQSSETVSERSSEISAHVFHVKQGRVVPDNT